MLKWFINRRLSAFERAFAYDTSCMRELLATDTRAFMALARITPMASYRRDIPVEVYYAAKLTAAMAADCGTCTQLVVAMALADRVPAPLVVAVVRGETCGETCGECDLADILGR